MSLPFDRVLCCDFETFYSDDVGFSKQAMTEYIRDPQWETQTCAAKFIGSDDPTQVWVGHDEIAHNLRAIDWSRTALLAQHTNFEGLILTHHFGVYPAFWLDTMAMSTFVFGVDVSCGLDATAKRMGLQGKVHGDALKAVKGTRLADMPQTLLLKLCEYNIDDVNDTAEIYTRLLPMLPEDELKLIDITVRMYAEPTMLLDGKKLRELYESEVARKKGVLDRLAVPLAETLRAKLEAQEARYLAREAKGKSYKHPRLTRNQMLMKEFGSAEMFAAHLEDVGIDVPMKTSPRTGLPVPAFAKNDLEFQELAEHPNELVRDLVEARLMSKSNIVQTRAQTLMGRANYPTPIYLKYCAARTQRWGGGDSVNWQNPPKRGPGAAIRHALMAPPGTLMIIADASQIEARMNAWKAGQLDKLEAFAAYDRGEGPDIYCVAASGMYHRLITKEDKDERFGGKVLELSGGYGAGHVKINHTFRVGQFGPPVYQTLEETEELVIAWRRTNSKIHGQHKIHERLARIAFLGDRELEDGPIIFEGGKRGGYIHGPHGGYMFYPNVQADEGGDMWYQSKNGPVKLWSGQITENIIQFLARILLGQQMLRIQEEFPEARIVMSTHDEIGMIIEKRKAEKLAARTKEIMSTPAHWCHGVPLNADVQIDTFYSKA